MSKITVVLPAQSVITVENKLILDEEENVPFGLIYDLTNPCAVTAVPRPEFHPEIGVSFARSLMAEGLTRRVGGDNFTIQPIRRPSGVILLSVAITPIPPGMYVLPVGPYTEFLVSTYAAVPVGDEEKINAEAVDAALAAMFPPI